MNDLKDGDWRMTVRCIHSGQTQRYGDTVRIYRAKFEWISWDTRVKPEDKKWELAAWNQDIILSKFKAVTSWYDKDKMPDPFVPVLEYIKKIDEGVWEICTRAAYND